MKKTITTIITVLLITVMTVSMSTYSYAQIKGDVNDDGGADNKDVVALFRYVSAGIKAEDESIYDFNGDGVVDNKDVVGLFRDLCAENAPETFTYVFKLYGNGEGNSHGTTDYPEKDLFKSEITEKEGIENKKVTIFGQEREMSYVDTVGYCFYDERSDCYFSSQGLVDIGENTGRITGFTNKPEKNESDFTPPVNANSTRQEFIDYAKDVILEYTGVSVQDCDAIITTYKISTKYQFTAEDLEQDFINFIDKDPDFSAIYNITFRRKFSGVYRKDQISADIRSDGEVVNLQCHLSDEKYAPFLETELDAEGLRQSAENVFNEQCISHEITLYAIPDGNKLWVMADVNYKYDVDGELFGSVVQYITKVAEIPSDQTEPDPVDTEFETWDAYAGTEAE